MFEGRAREIGRRGARRRKVRRVVPEIGMDDAAERRGALGITRAFVARRLVSRRVASLPLVSLGRARHHFTS